MPASRAATTAATETGVMLLEARCVEPNQPGPASPSLYTVWFRQPKTDAVRVMARWETGMFGTFGFISLARHVDGRLEWSGRLVPFSLRVSRRQSSHTGQSLELSLHNFIFGEFVAGLYLEYLMSRARRRWVLIGRRMNCPPLPRIFCARSEWACVWGARAVLCSVDFCVLL